SPSGQPAGDTFVTTERLVTVGNTAITANAGAQNISIPVTAAADTGYIVRSSADWIQLVTTGEPFAPVFGPGNSTVTVSVGLNPSASIRSGTVTIGGVPVVIVQDAGGTAL